MKNKKQLLLLFFLFCLFLSSSIHSQEWHWEWASKITAGGAASYINPRHSNFRNNINCRVPYENSIYYPDTVFYNSDPSGSNYSIPQYDSYGRFQQAIDLQVGYNGDLHYPKIVSDKDLNIYISGPFTSDVTIQNTIIDDCNDINQIQPDILIAKLNADNEVLWTNLICGNWQDELNGLLISENNDIYISTSHHCSPSFPTTIAYLGQDTAFAEWTMESVLRVDKDGNIIWRKEIYGWLTSYLFEGVDKNIHFWGRTVYYIAIDGDTIQNPYDPNVYQPPFIISFDTNGTVQQATLIDKGFSIRDLELNSQGEYYFSGSFRDSLIIQQDTLYTPEGQYNHLIGKLDAEFNVLWYHVVYWNPYYPVNSFRIALDNDIDHLTFMTSSVVDFQLDDTILSPGNHRSIFVGEFDSEGNLIEVIKTEGTDEFASFYYFLDNCNNPILGGHFKGEAYFGGDTLSATFSDYQDGFVAKIIRNETQTFNLGQDTIVCENITLQGPPDYLYYSWNKEISSNNFYNVSESGLYVLECATEDGCWAIDSIQVIVHPGFDIDLGADTSIKLIDTLVLTLPDIYESYTWSTGETSSSIVIVGSDYEFGTYSIWVEVIDGSCNRIDTLMLTVTNEFSVNENSHSHINIYPNPFTNIFWLEVKPEYERIEILNLNGIVLYEKQIQYLNSNMEEVDLKHLSKGLYFMKIETTTGFFIQKLFKM